MRTEPISDEEKAHRDFLVTTDSDADRIDAVIDPTSP